MREIMVCGEGVQGPAGAEEAMALIGKGVGPEEAIALTGMMVVVHRMETALAVVTEGVAAEAVVEATEGTVVEASEGIVAEAVAEATEHERAGLGISISPLWFSNVEIRLRLYSLVIFSRSRCTIFICMLGWLSQCHKNCIDGARR